MKRQRQQTIFILDWDNQPPPLCRYMAEILPIQRKTNRPITPKNHDQFRNPIIYQSPSDALDKRSNYCIYVNTSWTYHNIEQLYRFCLSTYGLYRIYYIRYAICEQKINSGSYDIEKFYFNFYFFATSSL